MESHVQRAMHKVTAEARQRKELLAKLKNENSMGSAQVTAQLAQVNVSGKDLGSLGSVEEINLDVPKDALSPEDEEVEQDNNPKIPEGHFMIMYGPKTVDYICQAINESFKLFWDGSISMYMDTVLSSKNNKDCLNTLLEMRQRTDNDEEPPITLMHGQETEKLLR